MVGAWEREEKEREVEEAVAMETLIPDMLKWRFVLPAAQRETYTNTNRTMWLILDICLADSRQTYRYNAVAIKKREGEERWGWGWGWMLFLWWNKGMYPIPSCKIFKMHLECIWINTSSVVQRFGQRCVGPVCRLFTAPVFSQHNENGAGEEPYYSNQGRRGKQEGSW